LLPVRECRQPLVPVPEAVEMSDVNAFRAACLEPLCAKVTWQPEIIVHATQPGCGMISLKRINRGRKRSKCFRDWPYRRRSWAEETQELSHLKIGADPTVLSRHLPALLSSRPR
jgi:hypothetical protein